MRRSVVLWSRLQLADWKCEMHCLSYPGEWLTWGPQILALLALPNCLVVPHIGSASHATRQLMARMAWENLLAGLAGMPLPHPVP